MTDAKLATSSSVIGPSVESSVDSSSSDDSRSVNELLFRFAKHHSAVLGEMPSISARVCNPSTGKLKGFFHIAAHAQHRLSWLLATASYGIKTEGGNSADFSKCIRYVERLNRWRWDQLENLRLHDIAR